jgi:hypothetical protein
MARFDTVTVADRVVCVPANHEVNMFPTITINVQNKSDTVQNFFFFQSPPTYSGGSEIYSNSLASYQLAPYASSGTILTFQCTLEPMAGVQQTHDTPVVGTFSGYSSASQPMEVATPGGTGKDKTLMAVSPLGLSPAVNQPGVQPGCFRIVTPAFDSNLYKYNAGSALRTSMGGVVLSNFVLAGPNQSIDIKPTMKFYVQTGTYTAGVVVSFTQSSATAALCDATPGYNIFLVTLQPDGSWNVQSSVTQSLRGEHAALTL